MNSITWRLVRNADSQVNLRPTESETLRVEEVQPSLFNKPSKVLLKPIKVFQFSYCILHLCNFCLVLFKILCEILTLFMHSSSVLGEHLYDHYSEFSAR